MCSQYPFNTQQDRPRSRSARSGEKKNLLTPVRNQTTFSTSSPCSPVIIRAILSQLVFFIKGNRYNNHTPSNNTTFIGRIQKNALITADSRFPTPRRLRLWSHCIRIWPIFYTDIHGRQRQNKQMRFSKCRRSQWRSAALTCTDMFRRLAVETKSFCFFPAVYASVSCSFVLST